LVWNHPSGFFQIFAITSDARREEDFYAWFYDSPEERKNEATLPDMATIVGWHNALDKIADAAHTVHFALFDPEADGELNIPDTSDKGEVDDFRWAAKHITLVARGLAHLLAEMDQYVMPELRRAYGERQIDEIDVLVRRRVSQGRRNRLNHWKEVNRMDRKTKSKKGRRISLYEKIRAALMNRKNMTLNEWARSKGFRTEIVRAIIAHYHGRLAKPNDTADMLVVELADLKS
jgi:hypothetical protein